MNTLQMQKLVSELRKRSRHTLACDDGENPTQASAVSATLEIVADEIEGALLNAITFNSGR